MPYSRANMKFYQKVNMDTLIGIACLFLLVVISGIVAFSSIPNTLAAKVTMEVYQQADGKAFGKETQLDIFSNDNHYLDGENLVAPYSSGSYTFAVYNSAASNLLPYTLNLASTNQDNIPLVFSLEKNGEYIYGGANDDSMLPLTEINLEDLSLNGNGTDLYTIHWRWKTTSDEEDTAFGTLAVERDLIYKLVITATGSIDESVLPDKGGNGIVEKIKDSLPKTGDVANILTWVIFGGLALLLIIWILLAKRRKKDEDNEDIHKNI